MTTISASSTIGIYLVPPSYTNPIVINPGVSISTSGNGVYGFTGAWTIQNTGGIASALGNGVYLGSGGSITNAAAASISGVDGANITGGIGTVVNDGRIAGNTTSSIGVFLGAGGDVTNRSGATISGYTGVDLTSGGAVTNTASASITGVYAGVEISGAAGTVVNHGSIAGTGNAAIGVRLGSGGSITNAAGASITGDAFGVDLSAGGTLTNAGTIVASAGPAVHFGGTGRNLLVLDPGYGLSGIAVGGTSAINTLELASATSVGTLSGLGTEFVNFAQTTIDAGASWVFNGTNTIEAGTTLTELGGATLTVSGTLVDDGTIVLDHGMLTTGGLTGNGLVAIAAGSTLEVQGTVSSGETLMLGGSGASLHLDAPGTVSGRVTDLGLGETIDLKGIDPASVSYLGGLLSFSGGSFALSLASPGSVTVSASSDGAAVSVPCFRANTLIRTVDGDVPVENLRAGDLAVTHLGVPRSIIWIGSRRIDLKRHPDPQRVMPVRIRAGALAEGVPRRDLLVSGDHALFIDGMLVPARLLVNDTSIVTETSARYITYYHVELDSHDILLAEDAPAESYLDTGDRGTFENAEALGLRRPRRADYVSLVWETQGCAELVVAGPRLARARARVSASANRTPSFSSTIVCRATNTSVVAT